MRRGLLLLCALALHAGASEVQAQVPAAEHWRTLSSEHFRVTFTPGLEPLAAHAAATAERAHAALREYLGRAPGGRVDIVLSDNVDYSNGGATPFPNNRIYLFAKPPVDVPELNYLRDWMELVITHELAHTFHLDVAGSFGHALRSVFGRVPWTWPLFPAIGSPGWAVEGLAVAVESGVTPTGRLHGSFHDMVARTAALEDRLDDIDRLSSDSPLWPGGQRVYIYGSLFLHDLQQREGEAVLGRIVRSSANAVVPPALWFDRVGKRSIGRTFRAAYKDWSTRATAGYRALGDSLALQGLTATAALVPAGGLLLYPRYSPDGQRLAYAHYDRRSTPETRVIDASSGALLRAERRNGGAPATWLGQDLLTTELEFRDRDHIYQDLYRISGGERRRLTRGARLQDVASDLTGSRIVAIQNEAGTNRIVRIDPRSGEISPLTGYDAAVHWSLPRWSPRADAIAAGRWQAGGRFDIVLLDTLGTVTRQLTDGTGVNDAPAWTPDGGAVVFASDRSGIPNLYAFELASGRLRQITNLLTGAFYPDVSPDGSHIAFSAYHHDGFHIETMPFDPAAWRDAAAALMPQAAAASTPEPGRADTGSTTVSAYRPLASLAPRYWLPVVLGDRTGSYYGIASSGEDVVQRHQWSASAALDPGNGRSQGMLWYQYLGFPPLTTGGLQPALAFSAQRTWDRVLTAAQAGDPFIDEREDVASARTSLLLRRFRSTTNLGLAGEPVRRRRLLGDAPGRRLRDPDDDLVGARATAAFSNARTFPFSISAEDGVRTQLSLRQRWDSNPRELTDSAGARLIYDGGYREATLWSAGYRSLGGRGFAHAVMALRASALLRSGPGAEPHGVGGSSGAGLDLGSGLSTGGSEFLPVRGFAPDTRYGTRAWSATAELRLPLAMISRRAGLLPVYLDRLSSGVFLDAGDADCMEGPGCAGAPAGHVLAAAGAEARLAVSVFGAPLLLRGGAGFPFSGGHTPRGYFQVGTDF